MAEDARFDDTSEAPINLGALDQEDLKILSAMVQDAVFPVTEIKWDAAHRRLGLLLNRFRWEYNQMAKHQGRDVERVQSLLVFENVIKVASQGVDRAHEDLVLSVLSLDAEEADAAENVVIILAGDGAIRITCDAIEVTLKDVTRPYLAPSNKTPQHPV